MNFHISLCIAISTILIPTQELQKPGPQRPSVEQRSEIIVHTLPDLSGTWIIYDASEKVIPSPRNRLDMRFQRIEKLTAAAEEDTDVGAYTVIGIPGARKEVPFHSVKFDGETLRVRVGPIEFPDGLAYRNYWTETYAKNIGLIYKEVVMWEYQPPNSGNPGFRSGFGIKLTIIDHN